MSAIGSINVFVFSNSGHDLTILNIKAGQLSINGSPDIAADTLAQLAAVIPSPTLEAALANRKEGEVFP